MFTALGENNMSDEGWEEQRRLSRCRGRMSSTQHALMITPWMAVWAQTRWISAYKGHHGGVYS